MLTKIHISFLLLNILNISSSKLLIVESNDIRKDGMTNKELLSKVINMIIENTYDDNENKIIFSKVGLCSSESNMTTLPKCT